MADSAKEALRDFSVPFSVLSKIELKQPIFGSNYILGHVKAAPGGKFLKIVALIKKNSNYLKQLPYFKTISNSHAISNLDA